MNWRPHTETPYDRVEISNPADGGVFYWLVKFYAFGLCCLVGAFALLGLGAYVYFATTLPPTPDLSRFSQEAAATTIVRGWDGTPLAEWAQEYREIHPLADIPKPLVSAFLAVEDRRFYEHAGLDYRGIMRALLANLKADRVAQGGSTITQQVAKSFLSSERTMTRKVREAILSRRLEAHNSKDEILTLYLNQIFLGHGAYGVAAAARRYFDKSLAELDVGEMALIAGLAGAPSRFSPLLRPDLARTRRDHVLDALQAAHFISESEATTYKAKPVVTHPAPDIFHERSPYFAEHIRRDLGARYGEEALWRGGLQVETTVVPWIDSLAQENTDFSLRKLDKRQGYRGPVARLLGDAAERFRQRSAERYGDAPLEENKFYLGLVESASPRTAKVLIGTKTYELPRSGFAWASPYSVRNFDNDVPLADGAQPIRTGDVIWVSNAHRSSTKRFGEWTYDEKNEVSYIASYRDRPPPKGPPKLQLEQQPKVQGAVFAYDHRSGYVISMVGGNDADRSQFNRVVQACRQPGSTYKPIYYSLALDQGYGYASLLNDIPRAEVDPITGEVWTPTNLNNTSEYQVTLEYALIWSKNVPSVQLFKLAGGLEVEKWARRLGFTTPIIPDQALALGASCARIDESTRAFSAFARNGLLSEPVYIRRVRNRQGVLLEDNTDIGDPMGSPTDRLDRLVALATTKAPTPVIPPRTAWLTSQLLRHVVTNGHAPAMRNTQIPFAGKTGTSSATMDAWFIGYTSRWMLTTWIGDDLRERPLGRKDASFMLTVPMSARFLNEVKLDQPLEEIPWERPPGVKKYDTGGTLRTSMDDVKDDAPAPRGKKG